MKKVFKKIYAGLRGALVLGVGVFIGATALDSFGLTIIGWGSCVLSIGAGLFYGRKVYRVFVHNDLISAMSGIGLDSGPEWIHFTTEAENTMEDLVEYVNSSECIGKVYVYGKQLYEYQTLVAAQFQKEEQRLILNFGNEVIVGVENPQNIYVNRNFIKVILADLVWIQTQEGKDCYELRGGEVLELASGEPKPTLRPLVTYDGALFILLELC
ncbi:MAG: hypothetical protein ACPGJS_11225 [Flammeovirgaceae bacterium]